MMEPHDDSWNDAVAMLTAERNNDDEAWHRVLIASGDLLSTVRWLTIMHMATFDALAEECGHDPERYWQAFCQTEDVIT